MKNRWKTCFGVWWYIPEHESNGGEEGDDSAEGDVAPRGRRQSWTVQQDVQPIQKVRHLKDMYKSEVVGVDNEFEDLGRKQMRAASHLR